MNKRKLNANDDEIKGPIEKKSFVPDVIILSRYKTCHEFSQRMSTMCAHGLEHYA